ncbi:MAG: ATP-dependent zinc metalloprotease FtsH, partial [Faecalibacterium sp.]|nr:ATP-dependent zinc metalloprotease FtsH [Faecalibacterium sp.]
MQPNKKPSWNPLIAAVGFLIAIMVWALFFSPSDKVSESMNYSKVMGYFKAQQVTAFDLDLNTGVITLSLKEGERPLPEKDENAGQQMSGGMLSGMLTQQKPEEPQNGGVMVVSYTLPYLGYFLQYEMKEYID